jgi:glycosyltransferase involved in cell wall biosynthesis
LSLKGFSIVVCTYNGKNRLSPTLDRIARLKVPGGCSVELIVVDNASTDGTDLMVRKRWAELQTPFPLCILREAKPGKAYAVEAGYDAAGHSYIVTADDDNWLEEDYLLHALELFEKDPDIGILQGKSTGVYETTPPDWIKKDNLEHYFVIGPAAPKVGYYEKHMFGAWGAGMVIRKEDWSYLRSIGFSFLTSKLAGKAAGEDHELAIALLLMGRKIYYSDQLQFRHYMPADRIQWDKLKANFETFGYVSRFNFLYALALHAHRNGYTLTKAGVTQKFRRYFYRSLRSYTWKQHLAYWLLPQEEYYQLRMHQFYAQYKWFTKLSGSTLHDLGLIQKWMVPLLKQDKSDFSMEELYMLGS